jgi:serine/threonine protein kinase
MAEKPSAKVSRLKVAPEGGTTPIPRVEVIGALRPHWLGEALECREPGGDDMYYVVAVDPAIDVSAGDVGERLRTLKHVEIDGLPTRPKLVRLADRRLGLAYPYLGTASLNEVLSGHAMPLERALSIVRQSSALLGKLHAKGAVHGALTLDGVILTPGDSKIDTVSIADYGLRHLFPNSKELAPAASAGGIPISPERALGLQHDAAEDVYALGCLAFALLTGEPPLVGREPGETMRRHAIEDAPKLAEFDSRIDKVDMIGPVIDRALSKEPADRHANAREFDQALARALRDASVASVSGVHKALPKKRPKPGENVLATGPKREIKSASKASPKPSPKEAAKVPPKAIKKSGSKKTTFNRENSKQGQADHERLLKAVGADAKQLPPPVLAPPPGAGQRVGEITAALPAIDASIIFDEELQVDDGAAGKDAERTQTSPAPRPKSKSKQEKLAALKKKKSNAGSASLLAGGPKVKPPSAPAAGPLVAPITPKKAKPVVASPLAMATAAAAPVKKPAPLQAKVATKTPAQDQTKADTQADEAKPAGQKDEQKDGQKKSPPPHQPAKATAPSQPSAPSRPSESSRPTRPSAVANPLLWTIPAALIFGSVAMLYFMDRPPETPATAQAQVLEPSQVEKELPKEEPADADAKGNVEVPAALVEPEDTAPPVEAATESTGETGASLLLPPSDEGLVLEDDEGGETGNLIEAPAAEPIAETPPPAEPAEAPAVDAEKTAADGTKAFKSGQTSLATRLFKKALTAEPKQLDALTGLATIYFDQGKYSKSAYYGRKAVMASPRKSSLRISLGDAYYKDGKNDKAREQYLKAKKLGSAKADRRLKKVGG